MRVFLISGILGAGETLGGSRMESSKRFRACCPVGLEVDASDPGDFDVLGKKNGAPQRGSSSCREEASSSCDSTTCVGVHADGREILARPTSVPTRASRSSRETRGRRVAGRARAGRTRRSVVTLATCVRAAAPVASRLSACATLLNQRQADWLGEDVVASAATSTDAGERASPSPGRSEIVHVGHDRFAETRRGRHLSIAPKSPRRVNRGAPEPSVRSRGRSLRQARPELPVGLASTIEADPAAPPTYFGKHEVSKRYASACSNASARGRGPLSIRCASPTSVSGTAFEVTPSSS